MMKYDSLIIPIIHMRSSFKNWFISIMCMGRNKGKERGGNEKVKTKIMRKSSNGWMMMRTSGFRRQSTFQWAKEVSLEFGPYVPYVSPMTLLHTAFMYPIYAILITPHNHSLHTHTHTHIHKTYKYVEWQT